MEPHCADVSWWISCALGDYRRRLWCITSRVVGIQANIGIAGRKSNWLTEKSYNFPGCFMTCYIFKRPVDPWWKEVICWAGIWQIFMNRNPSCLWLSTHNIRQHRTGSEGEGKITNVQPISSWPYCFQWSSWSHCGSLGSLNISIRYYYIITKDFPEGKLSSDCSRHFSTWLA